MGCYACLPVYNEGMNQTTDIVQRRRRGAQLESALLGCAWDELAAHGFARFTMESVAAQAHTSAAVLYRRWASKHELALAAIEHYRRQHPIALPDTGTLRGDLMAMLSLMGELGAPFYAVAFGAAYAGLLAETGLTPAEMRDRIIGDQRLVRVRSVYERAHSRGEIALPSIAPSLLAMPFDLVRHDLFMYRKPVSPSRIRAIVDELFMPLVARSVPPKARRQR